MSDEPDETSETTPSNAELASKVDRIESAVEAIKSAITGGKTVHAEAQAGVQERLDAPGSWTEEMQRELNRRDEAAKQAEREAELGTLKEDVRTLKEKPPVQPPRWIERWMGYHG